MYVNYLPYCRHGTEVRRRAPPGARVAVRVRGARRGVRHRPHRRGRRPPSTTGSAPRRPGRSTRATAPPSPPRSASRPRRTPTSSPCRHRVGPHPVGGGGAGAARRGRPRAWVMSVCSGAFMLGAAGLLDGRECTTHWRHAAELAAASPAGPRRPRRALRARRHGDHQRRHRGRHRRRLYLVRTELGSAVATTIARRMVVPPHRDGGQRQFIDRPVPTTTAESLGPVLDLDARAPRRGLHRRRPRQAVRHVGAHLRPAVRRGDRHHAAPVAHRPASAARRGAARGHRPRRSTVAPSRFGSAALLRHHFTRCTGITPTAFRTQRRLPA